MINFVTDSVVRYRGKNFSDKNNNGFDRVNDDGRKKTIIIRHPCAKMLWSQGELVAVRSNLLQAPANITRYTFPKK